MDEADEGVTVGGDPGSPTRGHADHGRAPRVPTPAAPVPNTVQNLNLSRGDSSSSDSSFDWEYYDDGGHPLVDHTDDSVLVPMEADVWYTEEEADKLLIFAASYRETRSGLQKTKIGRDQKRVINYHRNSGKKKGKGKEDHTRWDSKRGMVREETLVVRSSDQRLNLGRWTTRE